MITLQDKLRTLCIESYNKEYLLNDKLKPKLKGRNQDYHVSEMENYEEMKKSIEVLQNNLNRAKEKSDNLLNSTTKIREMLENLKSKGLIKNQLVIDVVNRDKTLVFIDLVDKTIAEYQNIQELSVTLKEVENELLTNRKKIEMLAENNEANNLRIETLTKNIKEKDDEIKELQEENISLKKSLQHFKNLFYNLVQFLMDRIYRNKEKEKYMEFAKELYTQGALDDDTFRLLQGNNNLNNHKELEIEKDDIER